MSSVQCRKELVGSNNTVQLSKAMLQDLMCCRDVYGVALFVHKCMKIADAAAVAAARQQPR
jgi:hypothetical protein